MLSSCSIQKCTFVLKFQGKSNEKKTHENEVLDFHTKYILSMENVKKKKKINENIGGDGPIAATGINLQSFEQ